MLQNETETKPVSTVFDVTFPGGGKLAPDVIWKTLKQTVGKLGKSSVECEYGSEPRGTGELNIIARVGTDAEHCRMCIRTVLEETPPTMRIATIEPPPRG